MSHIERLHDAIRRLHGCESVHIETVPIKDVFQGKVVWEGEVEVFNLTGEFGERHCYAWSQPEDDGSERFFAVLKTPPIDSPIDAVRAMIASESERTKG